MAQVEPDPVDEGDVGDPPVATEPKREYRGTGIMWGAVGLGLVLAAFVIVVIQNGQSVELDFLWVTTDTPLSLIVAVTAAVSLLLGEAIGFIWRRRRRRRLQEREELRRLRRRER
jgi:uncharacterized integral membrane protein